MRKNRQTGPRAWRVSADTCEEAWFPPSLRAANNKPRESRQKNRDMRATLHNTSRGRENRTFSGR